MTDKVTERALLAILKIFDHLMKDNGRDNMAISIIAYNLDGAPNANGQVQVQQVANIPDETVIRLYRGWVAGTMEQEDTIGEVVGHG